MLRIPAIELLIIISLSAVMPVTVIQGQSRSSLTGKVIDAKTDEPLIGANVYFRGTGIGGITDGEGRYNIVNIPQGVYELFVSYIGYEDYQENIQTEPGEALNRNIRLEYSGGVELEGVVITAQAKGQIKAINQQLAASSLKNVIAAERIQELPDANAAESLSRLPGIALLRSGGEGAYVVVRGMSPKYSKVMIDGIEIPSTGSYDRSTNLSMISPYSLEGIEVYKSATAEQDADFIGGLVNFQLKTAPVGFNTDFLAEGSYNNLKGSYNDYNMVGSISKRFFGEKFGMFIQANKERRNRSANTVNWGVWDRGAYDPDQTPNNSVFKYSKSLSDVIRQRNRTGATFVMDYQIKGGEIILKNFYNRGLDDVQSQQEQYGIDTHRDLTLSTSDASFQTTILSNIFNYKQQLSSFNVNVRASHSFSSNENPRTVAFSTANSNLREGFPSDSVQDYYDYNESLGIVRELTDKNSVTKQRQYEVSLNLNWNFYISSHVSGKIKLGGKLRSREKSYDTEIWIADLGNSNAAARPAIYRQFPELLEEGQSPSSFITYPKIIDDQYDPGEFLKGQFDLGPRVDIPLMNDIADFLKNEYYPSLGTQADRMYYYMDEASSTIDDYSGNELLGATYILTDLFITSKLNIIPGIRFERNRTEYSGKYGNARTYLPGANYFSSDTTHTRENTFWLPNLQVKYEPFGWMQIRFGYTNTLARPEYRMLVPSQELQSDYQIQKNNFNIRPEHSRNLDLMVSIKENHIGLFTLGVFTKNIHDKIYWGEKRYIHDPAEYSLPPEREGEFIITQFNNPYDTKVRGMEVDWQTIFWYLPGPLKGLVMNANYTYTFSEAHYPTTDIEGIFDPELLDFVYTNIDSFYVDRLIDQPTHVFNISLGYDYRGFSARVSVNHQSDMFRGDNKHLEFRSYSGKYTRWDLSLKQSLPLPGLQIYANINNITRTVEQDYILGAGWPVREQYYGLTATLGLRWRFQHLAGDKSHSKP